MSGDDGYVSYGMWKTERLYSRTGGLPKIVDEAGLLTTYEDEKLEEILADITSAISTGKNGDGKVFVYDVYDAMRIRTSERGDSAL